MAFLSSDLHNHHKHSPVSIYTPAELLEQFNLRPISTNEATSIIKKSKITGSPFWLNGQSYKLTPKYLEKVGLVPEFTVNFPNLEISLSRTFLVNDHTAALAYIKPAKSLHYHIISYYRDRAQGIWRLLPDYITESTSGSHGISRFGTGYTPDSLNLPILLQLALQRISLQSVHPLTSTNAAFCFAGTVKSYPDPQTYRQTVLDRQASGAYYQTTSPKPHLRLTRPSQELTPPQNLVLTGSFAPDFTTLLPSAYQTQTSFSGVVAVDICASQDRKYLYSFCRTPDHHAWLSQIQLQANYTPVGLPDQWVALGNYGTPLYLSGVRAGAYGDQTDRKHGQYVSMWPKYLSQAPFIQDYLDAIQD